MSSPEIKIGQGLRDYNILHLYILTIARLHLTVSRTLVYILRGVQPRRKTYFKYYYMYHKAYYIIISIPGAEIFEIIVARILVEYIIQK